MFEKKKSDSLLSQKFQIILNIGHFSWRVERLCDVYSNYKKILTGHSAEAPGSRNLRLMVLKGLHFRISAVLVFSGNFPSKFHTIGRVRYLVAWEYLQDIVLRIGDNHKYPKLLGSREHYKRAFKSNSVNVNMGQTIDCKTNWKADRTDMSKN